MGMIRILYITDGFVDSGDCPVCDSHNSWEYCYEDNLYTFFKCKICGFHAQFQSNCIKFEE